MIAHRYVRIFFLIIILHTSHFSSQTGISPQVMSNNIINCRKCCCMRLFLISNLTGWFYKWTGAHSHQKTFPAHDVWVFFSTFSSPYLSLYFVSSFSQCQHSKAVFVLLCWHVVSRLVGWLQLNHNSIPQVCLNRLPGPVLHREPALNASLCLELTRCVQMFKLFIPKMGLLKRGKWLQSYSL